jgi:hypothetical protein
MGADFSAQLIFGMPVTEDDFWQVTGTKMVCPKGHEQPSADMAFCPKCGKKFESAEEIAPTEALEKFAAAKGFEEDHDAAWSALEDGDEGGLGFLCVDKFQGTDCDRTTFVLGFQLADVGEYGHGDSTVSIGRLLEMKDEIRKEVEMMGLEFREPIIATTLYCSY